MFPPGIRFSSFSMLVQTDLQPKTNILYFLIFYVVLITYLNLLCFSPSFSVMSYQTLPRNMPSHRAPPAMPHYGDPGYRTLPRNSMARPDSICSMSPSMYDQAMGLSSADKRRSMRDDTMWQLYEWQQRQAYTPTRYDCMESGTSFFYHLWDLILRFCFIQLGVPVGVEFVL